MTGFFISVKNAISAVYAAFANGAGAALVGYMPAGATSAKARTLQDKAREVKSLLDGLTDDQKNRVLTGVGYDATNRLELFNAISNIWNDALAGGYDLIAPAGLYEIGENSFPWRQQVVSALLDCKNITLYCEGPGTIFKTVSTAGADVFQLNGLKNFHVKGFPTLTAALLGTAGAGSNGCSVTNGFDNLTLEITPNDCQGIDKGPYIDGGKGLSIQTPTAAQVTECGTLTARVRAKGCAHGFGLEQDLATAITKKTAILVELIAEDCFIAAIYSAGASTGPLPAGSSVGLVLRGQAINCQKDIVIGRGHGVDIELQVTTTKTAAARRLDPRGVTWWATDTLVEGLVCAYVHNAKISLYGYKGACDYKARIGGALGGSSGLTNATSNSDIYLDLGGAAVTANIANIDAGGNSLHQSRIYATLVTSATMPAPWYAIALGNTLTLGPNSRFISPKIANKISMAFGADGETETGFLNLDGAITRIQGGAGGGVGLYDATGAFRVGIPNGHGIAIDGITTVAALGVYVGKFVVYNKAGAVIGYLPIYA